MKRASQLAAADCTAVFRSFSNSRPFAQRCLHTSPPNPATVAPITASGPPPKVPVPSADHVDSRVARRRKQSELLKKGQDLRAVAAGTGGGTAKQKRFWKDVHVKTVDGRLSQLKFMYAGSLYQQHANGFHGYRRTSSTSR
jgi:ATP synthase F1 complex assembly factor 2